MRFIPFSLMLSARSLFGAAAAMLMSGMAQAQTPAPSPPLPAASATQRAPVEQLTETIRVEDASNRIDEVRVGGETRSITVQPKGGMPSYQVAPASGERRWNVLGF
ncbi:MAG: hypothetical protein AUK52_10830 [Comamonadaceae bacterium CG2_30_60_41]|nr:MAG: hypothetical protein AUK52_10830 [Comamonadaceae bacterium CG2_30_60_41]